MAKRKNQYKSKSNSRLPLFIFFIGLVLILSALVIKINTIESLSFVGNIPSFSSQEKVSSVQKISIPDKGIALPIKETYIVNNSWGINPDGASHLITSANPGEKGNIIIYGHNTTDRFGSLKEVKTGSLIKLYTLDNKTHVYVVKKISVVNPTDITPLLPTKDEVLTIYTCTGFADLKRLVIQAQPFTI